MKQFFNISLSGLSEADASTVLEALESPELDKWKLSEGDNGDLLLIDVDSVWGHMDWLRATAEGKRCVAFTEQPSTSESDLLLGKPLDSEALIEMLVQVQEGGAGTTAPDTQETAAPESPPPAPGNPAPALVSEPPRAAAREAADTQAEQTGPEPGPPPADAPTDAESSSASAAVDDAAATVGSLLLGGGIEDPVWVESADGRTQLFIDPQNNVYRAPPQLKAIEKLLDAPVGHMRSIATDDPAARHAGPEQPIVRLLWFAALRASDGKLAPHLDPSSVWRLTRWPQIEREFPRHFRIATTMMKQAGTLEEIATAAKSPVEDVANFINAYYVAGYVAAEGSSDPADGANSTAGVFSRLRRSFSRNPRQTAS